MNKKIKLIFLRGVRNVNDKRDCGDKLTHEEDVRVKQLCNREDEIDSEIKHLYELKEDIVDALGELKENI